MNQIFAKTALLPEGWARDVLVTLDSGRIAGVAVGAAPAGEAVDCLLPAPVNLHSHTFQRAMAGLTKRRSAGHDSVQDRVQGCGRLTFRLRPCRRQL